MWRFVLVLSIACITAACVIGAKIGFFAHRSAAGGAALIHQERRVIAAATPATCRSMKANRRRSGAALSHRLPAATGSAPRGLLEAPALGLVAPVVQGTSDAVLSDAVGHVRASSWPGQRGTSIFAGHDVTWFSQIDHLKIGDRILYIARCHIYVYRVTAHRVTTAGSPVYDTGARRIVLDTCYPLNALYPTDSRYLVFAAFVRAMPTARAAPPMPRRQLLAVPAPPALKAQGLALSQNYAPVGALHISGTPTMAWRQTNEPLKAEAAALAAYFGLIRSASQGREAWWADLAPSVPRSRATGLWHGYISGYDTHLDVTLSARGDRIQGATLTAVVTTDGSAQPGTYRLMVTETVAAGNQLLATGFTMRRT